MVIPKWWLNRTLDNVDKLLEQVEEEEKEENK